MTKTNKCDYLVNSYHIPELRIKAIPQLAIGREARLELTLQNPTPYVLHVSLFQLEESDDQSVRIKVPEIEMVLPPKDDTADLDVDQNLLSQFNDDQK